MTEAVDISPETTVVESIATPDLTKYRLLGLDIINAGRVES